MNVKSMARVKYSYNLDGINLTDVITSNVVNTEILKKGLTAKLISSNDFFKNGDIMAYNIIISNTGTYEINNICLEIKILEQDFILNTLKYSSLNDSKIINVSYEFNDDTLKIFIPKMFESECLIIGYKTIMHTSSLKINQNLKITCDDLDEIISKPLVLKQGFAKIECFKKVNDDVTFLNSNLTYELTLRNTGNISAYNVEVFDELPKTFVLNENDPIICNDKNLEYNLEGNILSFNLPEVNVNNDITVFINGRIVE